jgi:hypothetical protein
VGAHAVGLCGGDQADERLSPLAGAGGADEQPVLAAYRYRASRVFDRVVVDWPATVVDVSVNRDLRMCSSLISGAILSTFNWSENSRAGQIASLPTASQTTM